MPLLPCEPSVPPNEGFLAMHAQVSFNELPVSTSWRWCKSVFVGGLALHIVVLRAFGPSDEGFPTMHAQVHAQVSFTELPVSTSWRWCKSVSSEDWLCISSSCELSVPSDEGFPTMHVQVHAQVSFTELPVLTCWCRCKSVSSLDRMVAEDWPWISLSCGLSVPPDEGFPTMHAQVHTQVFFTESSVSTPWFWHKSASLPDQMAAENWDLMSSSCEPSVLACPWDPPQDFDELTRPKSLSSITMDVSGSSTGRPLVLHRAMIAKALPQQVPGFLASRVVSVGASTNEAKQKRPFDFCT